MMYRKKHLHEILIIDLINKKANIYNSALCLGHLSIYFDTLRM